MTEKRRFFNLLVCYKYVRYKHAKSMNILEIFNKLNKEGTFIKKEDFDKKYIQDMQIGAEITLHLPMKPERFKEYFLD